MSGGMRAAGIVADHPAERAAILSRGVRREKQAMSRGRGSKLGLDHAGLHDGHAIFRVDTCDRVHIPGEIQHSCGVGGLTAEGGAATARENGQLVLSRQFHSANNVTTVARHDDADWNSAIVRRVGRIDRAGRGIEAHVALDRGRQFVA